MKKPEIISFKGIVNTPIHPYIMNSWNYLLRSGLTDGASCPTWDDNAIAAYLESEPVGVLTWIKNEWCKTISVRLGYVEPAFRNRGIYRIIFSHLIQVARGEGISIIDGFTSAKNEDMQKVMGRLGREKYSIGYRFIVDASEKEKP